MKNSGDNVLIDVIAVLQSRNQDIRTVKLARRKDPDASSHSETAGVDDLQRGGAPTIHWRPRMLRPQQFCQDMSVIDVATTSIRF